MRSVCGKGKVFRRIDAAIRYYEMANGDPMKITDASLGLVEVSPGRSLNKSPRMGLRGPETRKKDLVAADVVSYV